MTDEFSLMDLASTQRKPKSVILEMVVKKRLSMIQKGSLRSLYHYIQP